MGKLDLEEMQNFGSYCGATPELNIQPRVYVRKMGGKYTEIVGVKSYEREDGASAGDKITIVVADVQEGALNNILLNTSDKFVDVKMEFLIGMLMVMSFSGFVEQVSGDKIVFSVSTPIATDVKDVVQ
jgi:hypothetical protein